MYKNILVPVVLGEGHHHEESFKVARLLANEDANFTVFHARDPIPAYVASEIPEDVLAATQREILESLQSLSTALPGAKPVLTTGHAGRAILDYADANDIDCIVIASHKPGLQNLLLGSTANRVVHHAKCSVHVIR